MYRLEKDLPRTGRHCGYRQCNGTHLNWAHAAIDCDGIAIIRDGIDRDNHGLRPKSM